MDNKNLEDLSRYRMEKSKEDLQASKILFDNKLFSQALNRSYYSIFHAVRALLAYENLDFKKHSALIGHFNREYINGNIFEKKYSKILMGAEKLRNKSDYNDFYIVTREEIEKQILEAEEFIYGIERHIKEYLEQLPSQI